MLYAAHLVGFLLTAVVSAVAAWWVHRRTDDRAGTVMGILLGTHVVMATAAGAQLLAGDPTTARAFAAVWWLFVLVNPVVWFTFAVYYSGREYWLTPTTWALLGVAVAGPSALLLTDPLHGAFFAAPVRLTEPFVHYSVQPTPLGGTFVSVANLLTLAGFLLLLRMHLFARRASKWQSAGLLVGMVAVFVPAFAANSGSLPAKGVPYGVYGAGVFGIIVGLSLFRNPTFGVAPLARDRLFSVLDDAILVVDAERRLVDFNGRAGALFPDVDGHVSDRLDDIYPALVGAADCPDLDVVEDFRNGSDGPFASAIEVTADGEERTLRVSVSEIASGGEPRGYALLLRDVTEIEAYAASLERKTAQLERFASVLSHDLRNPVAVATGRVELEQERRESENLGTALDALGRIEETIDDLLTLSREGETIEDPERVSLSVAVADAWATTATDDAALDNDVAEGVEVRADASRLQTMLENLFRNAVEVDAETVRVRTLDDGFCVEDDGPGVPEDERDQIFEYGFSSTGGTGFGLAIVDAVAEAHGWSVTADESPMGGTRFAVEGVEFVDRG